MKKYILIVISLYIVNCSSAQIIKSANNDIVKNEKARTDNLIEILKDSKMTEVEKKLIINELKSKDAIIQSENKVVTAYHDETVKAINDKNISEKKVEAASKEAGFGQAFKWLIYVAIGIGIIFVVYLVLTKVNLNNLIRGGK